MSNAAIVLVWFTLAIIALLTPAPAPLDDEEL